MTNQEKIDNAELVEQAKLLKIPSWHLKKLEKLQKEVDIALSDSPPEPVVEAPVVAEPVVPSPIVAEVVAARRKRAPKMPVSSINEDSRAQLLRELNAADPDCFYKFDKADISDAKLAAKGFERTGQMLKNDIVVRTDRDSYHANKNARMSHERRKMDSIDTDGDKIQSLTESPKLGKT